MTPSFADKPRNHGYAGFGGLNVVALNGFLGVGGPIANLLEARERGTVLPDFRVREMPQLDESIAFGDHAAPAISSAQL